MAKTRVGIAGYGNLGRGVELALAQNPDMELATVFTRRDPGSLGASVPATPLSEAEAWRERIDVLILCGGSAKDLPEQGPTLATMFNTVDSFDTHARIPEYFAAVDEVARKGGRVSVISTGWDPGLFSLARLLGQAVLPDGKEYTFWGKGVSQGHSDAVRRVPGVKAGVQYTIPREDAVARVRAGENPELSTREKHLRECFVVPEPGADTAAIEQAIVTMPNYFADYDTVVHFVSEEELRRDHAGMPHGGHVIRSGTTGSGTRQIVEFGLQLESNPEFTASVLVAYARAAHRFAREGAVGAKTVFDVPFAYLSPRSGEELRRDLL